ncbi:hypothetical protein TNCT_410151 [Trichonephila clavata]|uniref:Uncharacterized protein n=1 Tax=Trichonephila clavata TaxID=2740835 RepID=A0A8X6H6P3_TRICU|nr:hypothetical protein TNCT_410151 [Trichonephila clavata]
MPKKTSLLWINPQPGCEIQKYQTNQDTHGCHFDRYASQLNSPLTILRFPRGLFSTPGWQQHNNEEPHLWAKRRR